MKLTAITVLICACVCLTPAQGSGTEGWEAWKSKYQKRYQSYEDERKHWTVWAKNAFLVGEHNAKTDVSFQLELNSFADQSFSRQAIHLDTWFLLYPEPTTAPDSWDWRPKGAVGPVQNQGQLGDVLSIALTECVESFHFIQTGKMASLSVMETHDCCAKRPIASPDAFDCIRNIGGLCSQADYPKSAGKCMNGSCTAVAMIDGGKMVTRGDENALKEAVFKVPVLALIDASHVSFQLYKSGIYSDPDCSSTRLDHAVQVVGYGSENGQDYWICKNSWGANWGMYGYVRIARNKGNMCGIATSAMYPV